MRPSESGQRRAPGTFTGAGGSLLRGAMVVYRLETLDGRGPYGFSEFHDAFLNADLEHTWVTHPSPWDEFPSYYEWEDEWQVRFHKHEVKFGFASEKAFNEWFSPEFLEALKTVPIPLYLTTYTTKTYLCLTKQMIFDTKGAVRFSRTPI